MKRAIAMSVSGEPTDALLKYIEIAERDNWAIFAAGDHEASFHKFEELNGPNFKYITPERQQELYGELSELVGWGLLQRRNFAIIEAYKWGADIVATVDANNSPRDNWGSDCYVGETILVDKVHTDDPVFDPYSATEHSSNLWHRGFPLELLGTRQKSKRTGVARCKVLVQEDLIDGDPDIDAVCRIANGPHVKFKKGMPFMGDTISPFNAKNTFLSREVIKEYFIFPGIGSNGDIWASYWVQHKFPESVIYNRSSVYRPHSDHDHVKDMQQEVEGFKNNFEVAQNPVKIFELLPQEAFKAFRLWQELFQ